MTVGQLNVLAQAHNRAMAPEPEQGDLLGQVAAFNREHGIQ